MNHRQRDRVLGEDACLTRTGNGPANRTCPGNIAPAAIFANRRRAGSPAETRRRMQLDRGQAIRALSPPRPGTAGKPTDIQNESPGAGKRNPRRPMAAGQCRNPSGAPPGGHFRQTGQAERKAWESPAARRRLGMAVWQAAAKNPWKAYGPGH